MPGTEAHRSHVVSPLGPLVLRGGRVLVATFLLAEIATGTGLLFGAAAGAGAVAELRLLHATAHIALVATLFLWLLASFGLGRHRTGGALAASIGVVLAAIAIAAGETGRRLVGGDLAAWVGGPAASFSFGLHLVVVPLLAAAAFAAWRRTAVAEPGPRGGVLVVAFAGIAVWLGASAVLAPVDASAARTTAIAWYSLPALALARFVGPTWAQGLVAGLGLLIALLPWLDRGPETRLVRRPLAAALAVVVALAVAVIGTRWWGEVEALAVGERFGAVGGRVVLAGLLASAFAALHVLYHRGFQRPRGAFAVTAVLFAAVGLGVAALTSGERFSALGREYRWGMGDSSVSGAVLAGRPVTWWAVASGGLAIAAFLVGRRRASSESDSLAPVDGRVVDLAGDEARPAPARRDEDVGTEARALLVADEDDLDVLDDYAIDFEAAFHGESAEALAAAGDERAALLHPLELEP